MTSSINPNNINGAYPVAGQDNNSQGFRDNFTNTKTNFQYAAAEISDLQSKAVLKAALTGTTLNNNMNGSILSNFQGQNISGTVVSLGTLSGDVGINYSAGPYQTVTTAGSISLAFTNFTPAGTQDYVVVQVTISSTADTLTFPSAVGSGASSTSLIGINGLDIGTNTITFAATGTYLYSFTTSDAGSTIYLNDLTQGRNTFGGLTTVEDLQVDGQLFMNWVYGNGSPQPGAVMLPVTANIYDIGNASYRFRDAYFSGNVAVAGNISGNIVIDNIESIVGNVTAGNLLTGGQVSATANVTGGNLCTGGLISATGNITAGNVLNNGLSSVTGNTTAGNVLTGGLISATGNITGGNISCSGGSLTRAKDIETINFANITATGTYSLSTTSSINVLIANNTGYTATLNMPTTPVDGQICNFSISGNTVTLAAGTGTVLPTYAGSTTAGTGYRYVYRTSNTSWYRIG